ncbi:MAG: hypothetical protein AB7N76_35050 [Planctomycetota bacterium]
MQHYRIGQDQTPSLNPKQEKALRALLAGATNTEAAKQAGVQRSTLALWRKFPHFEAALRTAQAELREAACREALAAHRELLQAKLAAVRALRAVVEDKDASPADRTRAARALVALPLPEIPADLPKRPWTADEVEREQNREIDDRLRQEALSLQLDDLARTCVRPEFLEQALAQLGLPPLPGLPGPSAGGPRPPGRSPRAALS